MAAKGGGRCSQEGRPKTSATAHSREIRCPFFRSHSSVEIRCEAPEDRCRTCLLYERTEDKRRHQEIYCEAHYECCEVARMLMRDVYGED